MNEHKHEKGVKCPACGSKNTYGLSRVVGYFSRINNWNKSKQAELKARQKGDYEVKVKDERDINNNTSR